MMMNSTEQTVGALAARLRVWGRRVLALTLLVATMAGGFAAARHEPSSSPSATLD
jgi:hypothetical protein